MKLHWSPRSPCVRKVMVVAHEKAVADRLECVRTVVASYAFNEEIFVDNPLGKIPTLVLDDGRAIYDSHVICEYLDGLQPNAHRLFAGPDGSRLSALRRQALGDGFMDLMARWRGEIARPRPLRSSEYLAVNEQKFWRIVDALELEARSVTSDHVDIGSIAIGCGLAYADFRFQSLEWRATHRRLAAWFDEVSARPSFANTAFVEG